MGVCRSRRKREREREPERKRERSVFPFTDLLPKHLQWAGLRSTKTGAELSPCFPHGWQEPKYDPLSLPSRVCVSRKLSQELELGLKPRFSGMCCEHYQPAS